MTQDELTDFMGFSKTMGFEKVWEFDKAHADLIRQIELNQAVVVAIVHLSHDEKEKGLESKPVTCFMAVPREENSSMEATIVEAEVGDGTQPPVVRLKITDRGASG